MLTLTNKHGVPEAIVRAVLNDSYSRGDADFSVTQLLKPPQISALERQHQVVEDVSDRIWALLGQAVHVLLERAAKTDAGVFAEKRHFMSVTVDDKSYRVSGALDHLHFELGELSDYKITSVYARAGKDEWEAQLNLLRLLLAANNRTVARLQNVLIFRDWRPKEALQRDDYPRSQVLRLPVGMWPMEKAAAFLHERIRVHTAPVPAPCTDEERWIQPGKFALMKKGAKRAVKLFEAKPENLVLQAGQYLEERPTVYRRCESYCPVAEFCSQWAKDRPAEQPPEAEAA